MNRRGFLGGAAAGFVALGASRNREPDLVGLTISEAAERMKSGATMASALVEQYTERIKAFDRTGPRVNSIIEMNPDAHRIAEELDKERKSKGARSPMHGIPVLLKDNIGTADRMSTSAGSLALEGSHPAQDAFIAARLRAAGAVILGKTNLSEWANFRSEHSVSGWSGRGGQTRNPYALDRNPCGSSSGSGVAVAANFCLAAVGTETDGSIVCPSSINGVVGIKPTLGLVSRSGIIPIAHSQDTAGPMARTVRDAVILLGALAGTDDRDPATSGAGAKAQTDYTKYLEAGALKGARLGVARKYMGRNSEADKLIEGSLDAMKRQRAELIELPDLSAREVGDAEFTVLLYEFKADLNKYLDSLGPAARVQSLKDVIAFNEKNRDREMPYFGQDIMIQAEAKGPLTEKPYLEALEKSKKAARENGIDKAVAQHRLDAIVAPTAGPSWLIDWVNGDHESGGCSTLAAVAGYPHITVPAGYVFGLPIGLSFFGPAWSEPKLISLAYAYEQATKARREPEFLPSVHPLRFRTI